MGITDGGCIRFRGRMLGGLLPVVLALLLAACGSIQDAEDGPGRITKANACLISVLEADGTYGTRWGECHEGNDFGYHYHESATLADPGVTSAQSAAAEWTARLVRGTFAGGISASTDFVSEYQGYIDVAVDTKDTYELTLAVSHEWADGTQIVARRTVRERLVANDLQTFPLNIFDSRSRVRLGSYTDRDGNEINITRALLAQPTTVEVSISLKRDNGQSFTLRQAQIVSGRATFWQIGAQATPTPGPTPTPHPTPTPFDLYTFLDLSDTPGSYEGHADDFVKVGKGDVEFVSVAAEIAGELADGGALAGLQQAVRTNQDKLVDFSLLSSGSWTLADDGTVGIALRNADQGLEDIRDLPEHAWSETGVSDNTEGEFAHLVWLRMPPGADIRDYRVRIQYREDADHYTLLTLTNEMIRDDYASAAESPYRYVRVTSSGFLIGSAVHHARVETNARSGVHVEVSGAIIEAGTLPANALVPGALSATSTFFGLTDTPASCPDDQRLAVNGGQVVCVAPTSGTGGSATFFGLTDTPEECGDGIDLLAALGPEVICNDLNETAVEWAETVSEVKLPSNPPPIRFGLVTNTLNQSAAHTALANGQAVHLDALGNADSTTFTTSATSCWGVIGIPVGLPGPIATDGGVRINGNTYIFPSSTWVGSYANTTIDGTAYRVWYSTGGLACGFRLGITLPYVGAGGAPLPDGKTYIVDGEVYQVRYPETANAFAGTTHRFVSSGLNYRGTSLAGAPQGAHGTFTSNPDGAVGGFLSRTNGDVILYLDDAQYVTAKGSAVASGDTVTVTATIGEGATETVTLSYRGIAANVDPRSTYLEFRATASTFGLHTAADGTEWTATISQGNALLFSHATWDPHLVREEEAPEPRRPGSTYPVRQGSGPYTSSRVISVGHPVFWLQDWTLVDVAHGNAKLYFRPDGVVLHEVNTSGGTILEWGHVTLPVHVADTSQATAIGNQVYYSADAVTAYTSPLVGGRCAHDLSTAADAVAHQVHWTTDASKAPEHFEQPVGTILVTDHGGGCGSHTVAFDFRGHD
ncbi:MAG: hypothetical protein F4X54_07495 [Chloroflexi bacterium]|nr:hypothetical protein [Chloroflexota bacterium]